jgi:pyrroloquinoline quinone (PQQ) biosynthesis protein C
VDVQRSIESEHPWVDTLKHYVKPDWDDLVSGEWATNLRNGTWSTDAIRGWCLQLYPFVHTFPKFLAEALIKVEDDYARGFLIDNIRVEKQHAEHWLWMGEGFGIPRREMLALASGERPLLRDVQSLNDWIWYINAKGSLAEAVAATSFAIEGATGDLTRGLLDAFESYGNRDDVTMNPRTSKWFRNHAKYDDDHPRIALEVIVRYAQTDQMRRKVMTAARRSLQLMNLALLTASREYSQIRRQEEAAGLPVVERRQSQQLIPFPDRRVARRPIPFERRAS